MAVHISTCSARASPSPRDTHRQTAPKLSQSPKRAPYWSAPLGVDRISVWICPSLLGFRRMEAMTKHRSHSAAFKRQVAEEFLGGETLQGLSKRDDIPRQMFRVW